MSETAVETPEAEATETAEETNGSVEEFNPTAADLRKAGAGPEALALPSIDGEAPDRIEVKISGGVRLDRSDPADVALMRRLALGKEVNLRVVGVVAGKDARVSYDEDGYPGETTHISKVRVTTVYRPVGEGGAEARVGSEQLDLDGQPENEG